MHMQNWNYVTGQKIFKHQHFVNIYAKLRFITSRLKAFKDAARLYVSGNELNKIAPEYQKVPFPRLSLGIEG